VLKKYKFHSLRALPGGHSFFLKKKNQKKHFLSNDPLQNFAFGISSFKEILVAKFYNGLHSKNKEQLVFNWQWGCFQ
jgi:hypothetical protein